MNSCVDKAKKIIENDFKNISTLYDITKKIKCNYHTLRSDFVREEGITLVQYLNTIRCQKAEFLLRKTDWKLYRIASEVGYNNDKYFIKVFEGIYGKPPSKLRN